MDHIKDIHIEFSEENLSKYGAFPLLAWFMIDLLKIRARFKILTVKRKRNNRYKRKRYKCTFSGEDMAVGITTVILLGIKRFEKIDNKLSTERKLAELIGLKRFFDKTYARKFINEFTLSHLKQLDRANSEILRTYGDSFREGGIKILDIDQTTHTLESKKREKANRGFNKKNPGKPCYQWSVGFIKGEIVSQKLDEGKSNCKRNFRIIVEDVKEKLGVDDFIIRVDGGYMSAEYLDYIVESGYKVISVVNWDDFFSNNKELGDISDCTWETVKEEGSEDEKEKEVKLLAVGERKVYSKCKHKFNAVLVKIKQEDIKIKRNRGEHKYVIISSIVGLRGARATYEFYHRRQTIENFFKESKNPLNSGKIPSQKFRGNEAYLYFVAIAFNIFELFKKNVCQRYGRNTLLRLLKI